MLYASLLRQLPRAAGPPLRLPFLYAQRLQPMRVLGAGVQAFGKSQGLGRLTTLSEVLETLHEAAVALPGHSAHVEVVVACQRTRCARGYAPLLARSLAMA